MKNAQVIYEGSVKKVSRDHGNPGVNYFEFTDDYSIFDWGKMPDQIALKGKALSILGGTFFQALSRPEQWQALPQNPALKQFNAEFLARLFQSKTYERLAQAGLHHHFISWVDEQGQPLTLAQLAGTGEAPVMKVQALELTRPRQFTLDQHTLYHYDFSDAACAGSHPFLIPLEVIFRFGMIEGSSLAKRLEDNPHYHATLGLSVVPEKGELFERPVLEFFTKLEPKDRFLSTQEAYLISGLSETHFETLYTQTLLLALWLYTAFAGKRIELWDGKFEFAWSMDGLMLVDSIGPDELRLQCQGVQLSKEVIRQFYRDSEWEKAVRQAKVLSLSQPGSDWKTICREQLGKTPRSLTVSEKILIESMYANLANVMLDKPVMAPEKTFAEVITALRQQPVGASS